MNTTTRAVWFTSVILTLLIGVAINPSNVSAETVTNAQPAGTGYIRPIALVLYPTNASPGVIRLAKQFSATFGFMEPQSAITRPGCETWLAVHPSESRPGVPYYSVSVGEGGDTSLVASSEELLEKAMDRLKASAHSQSGQLVVPVGAFSYYKN